MYNKNIIIAGAGGYVGWSLVEKLLNNNFNIYAIDINFSDKQKLQASNLGQSLFLIEADLCNEADIKKIILDIKVIDGVVNCSYPRGPDYGKDFFNIPIDSLNKNINMHINSFFILTREIVKYFYENKKTISVINFASIYGTTTPKFDIYKNENFTMPIEYAFVKNSIISLSKYTSALIKDSKFRINTISPGGIFNNHSPEFVKKYSKYTRGKGMIDKHDVSGSVLFLLSDDSFYISGQNIIIDDGFSL